MFDRDDNLFSYWLRIFGAIALIKMASSLVHDAEKLITANVKGRHPEVDMPDPVTLDGDGASEWSDSVDTSIAVAVEVDDNAESDWDGDAAGDEQ